MSSSKCNPVSVTACCQSRCMDRRHRLSDITDSQRKSLNITRAHADQRQILTCQPTERLFKTFNRTTLANAMWIQVKRLRFIIYDECFVFLSFYYDYQGWTRHLRARRTVNQMKLLCLMSAFRIIHYVKLLLPQLN